jgi:hypothetical protein
VEQEPEAPANVGYDFLFWNDVVRPGSQIDPVVNPNLLPPTIPGGPNRPAPHTGSTVDLSVHGVSSGLGCSF